MDISQTLKKRAKRKRVLSSASVFIFLSYRGSGQSVIIPLLTGITKKGPRESTNLKKWTTARNKRGRSIATVGKINSLKN
jgi:hypothetical protein